MCEFVVYLDEKDGTRKEVARNIVVAKKRKETLYLMDAFGSTTTVKNATVTDVNTMTQELILVSD